MHDRFWPLAGKPELTFSYTARSSSAKGLALGMAVVARKCRVAAAFPVAGEDSTLSASAERRGAKKLFGAGVKQRCRQREIQTSLSADLGKKTDDAAV